MSETTTTASGGIGFGGALALLFIGLKLGGAIDWSWWWVLAPLWLPIVLVLVFLAGLGVFVVGVLGIAAIVGKPRR